MSFRESNRKFPQVSALARINDELREYIPRALERESAKVIAFKTGATSRQAENWRQHNNLPGGAYLIALGRAYPEIGKKLVELLHCEMGDGYDPSRILADIEKLLAGRR